MEESYITIKEFANKVNVSTQAIYQRLNKDLQSYLKVVDGKKLLNTEGLKLFNKSVDKRIEQEVDNNLVKTLQETLNVLKEQLQIRDKQLAEQRQDYIKQLEAKDIQIERLQKANENNQILIAQNQEKVKLLEEPKKSSFFSRFFRGKEVKNE